MKRMILGNYRIKPRDEPYNDGLGIREFRRRILSRGDGNANRVNSLSFYQAWRCKFEILDISVVGESEYFKAYGNRLSWNRRRTRSTSFETQYNLIDSDSRARKPVILAFLAQIIKYRAVFMLIQKLRMRPEPFILKINHFQDRFSTILRNRNAR